MQCEKRGKNMQNCKKEAAFKISKPGQPSRNVCGLHLPNIIEFYQEALVKCLEK